MSEHWRVEAAAADDDAGLAALARRALTDPWSESGFAAERANAHACVRVVRAGADVVGYLVAHLVTDEIEVLSIAVEPESRRRGIARALIVATLDEARTAGAHVAHLEVRAASAAARALYASLGFADCGRRARYYTDGEDAIRMRLQLAAPDGPRLEEAVAPAGGLAGRDA